MMSEDESFSDRVAQVVSQSSLNQELTDSEDEAEFIHKYGKIEFQYIKRPKLSLWFTRPHALNYFKDGVLFRTKGERSLGRTELFLDLMYVGIVANLAGLASEDASGGALLQYILMFIPYWTVWADIKDFTNYYYNEDLTQRLYILWILVLLTLSANSHHNFLHSRAAAAYTIVPYMLCRVSLAVSLWVYSFYIPEHRSQQRLYSCTLMVTTCVWIPVILGGTKVKIALAIVAIVLEHVTFCLVFHPWVKRLMGLTTSTALNIEHEVERFSAFFTVAVGEFLYKVVAALPLGAGFTAAFARAVLLLVVAYCIFWLYLSAGTSTKAIHPLRHSAFRAITWIYSHVPLIGAIVLAADSGGELLNRRSSYESVREEGEPSLRALSFFYCGGICVALNAIAIIGLLDECRDEPKIYLLPKFWRIVWRIPVGFVILILAFPNMDITLMLGMSAMILVVLLVFETVVCTPKDELLRFSGRKSPRL